MLEIISANYGTMDVTEILKNSIKDDLLSITVSNTTFGKDPQPNIFKKLFVKYIYNGETHDISVYEGSIFNLPDTTNTTNIVKSEVDKIFESWRIVFDPNNPQAQLAAERIKICDGCEFKATTPVLNGDIYTRCTVCGCSLKGKIYTPHTFQDAGGSCPKELWKNIEEEWLKNKKI